MNLLWACTKEKVLSVPATPEPTKWEKIAGHYKVYDTTDVYLYDMDFVYIHDNATNTDSIRFENFDDDYRDNLYKIGYTTQNLENRVNELYTTDVPVQFDVEFWLPVNNLRKVEEAVHHKLKKNRINNEESS